MQDEIDNVRVGIGQMIGQDNEGPARHRGEMFDAPHSRFMPKYGFGQRVVNLSCEGISRIIIPCVSMSTEPGGQRRQRIRARIVDGVLDMLADFSQVRRVVAREKHRDRLDE
jgi:hypothetical protein